MVTVTTNSTSNTQNILKFIKQWSNISFLDCLSQSPLCRWSGLRSDLFTWKSLSQCRSARLSHANIAIHHNDTSHHNTQCTFYMLQQKSTARMSMLRFFLNCRKCNKCLIGRKNVVSTFLSLYLLRAVASLTRLDFYFAAQLQRSPV